MTIWGDIPTWITTIAIVIAAGQFLLQRRAAAAEREREAKAQATGLAAWMATDVDSTPRVYGVVIANTSDSTFHSVTIAAIAHGAATERPIELDILPPGTYFVALNPAGAQYTWDFAVPFDSYDGWLRPYMKSPKYAVASIEFSDNLRQRWHTDTYAVLTLIR